MRAPRIVPPVAAAMAALMAALAVAPTVQADATTIAPSQAVSLDSLAVGASYAGPCPGPLLQCLTFLVGQYCNMSPTCTLVLDLGTAIVKIVVDKAGGVLSVVRYVVDRTAQLAWDVVTVVVDYVDDLIDYVWPYVDRVVDLVLHVVALVLDLADDAAAAAARLLQKVGAIIQPYLDYVGREIAALLWLVDQVVDEACWVVMGGCPFVAFGKLLTGKRNYALTDTSLTPRAAPQLG